MYVTVTTNANALITSHMGVTMSVEGAARRLKGHSQAKGTSVDLHAFAAKVMLMRNPLRKYMINAPMRDMEKIIAKALPNSIHVGTKEQEAIIMERKDLTFQSYMANNHEIANVRKNILENLDDKCKLLNDHLAASLKYNENKSGPLNEESKKKVIDEFLEEEFKNKYITFDCEKFFISDENREIYFDCMIKSAFRDYKKPFSTLELDYILKHPPIISAEVESIRPSRYGFSRSLSKFQTS